MYPDITLPLRISQHQTAKAHSITCSGQSKSGKRTRLRAAHRRQEAEEGQQIARVAAGSLVACALQAQAAHRHVSNFLATKVLNHLQKLSVASLASH